MFHEINAYLQKSHFENWGPKIGSKPPHMLDEVMLGDEFRKKALNEQ
jgi:hypothetical protein